MGRWKEKTLYKSKRYSIWSNWLIAYRLRGLLYSFNWCVPVFFWSICIGFKCTLTDNEGGTGSISSFDCDSSELDETWLDCHPFQLDWVRFLPSFCLFARADGGWVSRYEAASLTAATTAATAAILNSTSSFPFFIIIIFFLLPNQTPRPKPHSVPQPSQPFNWGQKKKEKMKKKYRGKKKMRPFIIGAISVENAADAKETERHRDYFSFFFPEIENFSAIEFIFSRCCCCCCCFWSNRFLWRLGGFFYRL